MSSLFAWKNLLLTSSLTAGSAEVALGVGNLKSPLGDASSGWQTRSGVLTSAAGASFGADTGNPSSVHRAFLLARTNLTPASTVRWRVGSASILDTSPTLAIQPTGPGWTPPSGWTFTRGSSGTYFDANGVLQTATNDTPRWVYSSGSLVGLLLEDARTNLVLWNRDLTNAAWVKTSMTASKTATGIDNVSNSATILTASGANGTALQSITLAAATRRLSAYVRRRTGTGTVQMTGDGGTTWTPISLTSSFQRFDFNITNSNPNVGFRCVTSGDAIDVDFVQLEQTSTAYASTPIATSGASVTRSADLVVYNGAALTTPGTILLEGPTGVGGGFPGMRVRNSGATNYLQVAAANSNGVSADLQVVQASSTVYDGPDVTCPTSLPKLVLAWNSGYVEAWVDNTSLGSYTASLAAMTEVAFYATFGRGVLGRVWMFNSQLASNPAKELSRTGFSTLDPSAVTYDSGVIASGVTYGYGQSIHIAPNDVIGRCVRCDIEDPANPDNFINVGLAFVGPAWIPYAGVDWNTAMASSVKQDKIQTRGGQEHVDPQFRQRGWDLSMDSIRKSEVYSFHQDMEIEAYRGTNVLFIPELESGNVSMEAVYGLLEPTSALGYIGGTTDYRTWRATIRERL